MSARTMAEVWVERTVWGGGLDPGPAVVHVSPQEERMHSSRVGPVIEEQNVLVLDLSENVVYAGLGEQVIVKHRDDSAIVLRSLKAAMVRRSLETSLTQV